MSLSKVCEEIRRKSELVEKFEELKSNQERIKFTYDVCKAYLSNFNIRRTHKSNDKSWSLRSQANFQAERNRAWKELRWVNESLAFAADPAKLRISYMLRSNILLSIGHPDAASADMLRASDLTSHEKEQEDLSRVPVPEKTTSAYYLWPEITTPPLDRKKSSFFDSASEAVGLRWNDRWERHLVAQNDIKTGEVLIVEKPYASVLLSDHVYTHCAHCFRRCPNLLPCSKCCFAMFCNEQCERESRERYHEIECDILDILFFSEVERMALLALRILICAASQGRGLEELREKIHKWEDSKNNNRSSDLSKSSQCYRSSDFMNIYNLVTHSDVRAASDLFKRCVVSAALIQLLSKHTKFFAHIPAEQRQSYEVFCVGVIFHFMQSLPCNAHEISEYTRADLVEIGAGIYATLSLLNHSCDPNVVRHSYGDSLVLRAIKPIKKGEQICDNYGYHYATHALYQRQTSLMEQYYFKCECIACSQCYPVYLNLQNEVVKFKDNADEEVYKELTKKFEKNFKGAIRGVFNNETIKEFTEYLDYLDEFVQLPCNDFNKCQEALKHCWCFTGNRFILSSALKKYY